MPVKNFKNASVGYHKDIQPVPAVKAFQSLNFYALYVDGEMEGFVALRKRPSFISLFFPSIKTNSSTNNIH